MKYPVIEFFKGEGVINKDTWLNKSKGEYDNILETIKKYNIDTALLIFIKQKQSSEILNNKIIPFFKFKTVSEEQDIYLYNKKFLIANVCIGAPVAVTLMEELGFIGIKNFIACGSCGLIDHTIDTTNFFLIEKAIRDEGVSYKYLKPSIYAYTDKGLTDKLAEFLKKKNLKFQPAITWTTDAFYRETLKAIEKRKKQGAICVDMESSAWCAVAKYRNYRFAQMLYTSDVTQQGKWKMKPTKEQNDLNFSIIKLMIEFVSDFVGGKL